MKIIKSVLFVIAMTILLGQGECESRKSSDVVQKRQQERLLQEGSSQIGMPAILNFRERKLLKDILELRDQTGILTYTYLFSDFQGKLVFFCESIGYGIPCATQFTNPQKIESSGVNYGYAILPQADPNGLFSPASAEGTWVMCKNNEQGGEVRPTYIEPRIVVSPFKLP